AATRTCSRPRAARWRSAARPGQRTAGVAAWSFGPSPPRVAKTARPKPITRMIPSARGGSEYAGAVIDDLHAVVAARLRGVGQRYTTGRRVLIDTLARSERPVTTAELVAAEPRLSQSTTYRNLAQLEQAGVVRTVIGTDDYSRFELTEELTGRHHHHLVCLS